MITITALIAETIAKSVISFGITKGITALSKNKESYSGRLTKIINLTIDDYKKQHSKSDQGVSFEFYDSQLFVDSILKFSLFDKSSDFNPEQIKTELFRNPEIIIPSNDDINSFLTILYKHIDSDEKLKILFFLENYQEEIFRTANKIADTIDILKKMDGKLDEIYKGQDEIKNTLDTLVNPSPNTFSSFINRLTSEYRRVNRALSEFSYKSGLVEFVEREEEQYLEKFREDERKFLWWCVTGQAGSGKSRFAYEYILKYQSDKKWTMKFLPWDDAILEFTTYDYEYNLLLIIDYVAANADKIGKWLHKLAIFDNRKYKIRVLLLEREGIKIAESGEKKFPYWYTRIMDGADGGNLTRSCFYKYPENENEFLQLESLSDLKITRIAKNYFMLQKEPPPSESIIKDEIINRIKEIDPQFQRPLYILFLTDAWIKEKGNIRHWDIPKLQNWINANEIKKLKILFENDIETVNAARCLIAFASAVSEVDLRSISRMSVNLKTSIDKICKFAKKHKKNSEQLFSCIGTDYSDPQTPTLKAMVPDIMGEYFCLDYLKDINDVLNNINPIDEFINTAWKYPEEYAFFLLRLCYDFEKVALVYNNLIIAPETDDNLPNYLYALVLLYVTEIYDNNISFVIEKLSNLVGNFLENSKIQLVCANGFVNISNKMDIYEAKKAVRQLEVIAEQYTGDYVIQLTYAKGLVNLSIKEDKYEAKEIIEKLARIVVKYAKNQEMQLVYASGLFVLSSKQDIHEAQMTIEKLACIAAKYSESPEIQQQYIDGLVNLLINQNLNEAQKTIGKIANIAESYTENQKIQLEYVRGLYNLSIKQNIIQEVQATIGKITHIVKKYSENQEILLLYTSVLLNLSIKQDLHEVQATIEKLAYIAEKFTKNQKIQLRYASGLVNLSSKQGLYEAKATIGKLACIAMKYAENQEIQLAYAKGLVILTYNQNLQEAQATIEKLTCIIKNHEENQEIRFAYVMGLVNLSRKQDINEAHDTIKKVSHIVEAYTENQKMQLICAKGLAELSLKQDIKEAQKTIEKLAYLSKKYAENQEIQLEYAKGLVVLLRKQDIKEAQETIEKLTNLAKKYTENQEIQLAYARGLFILSNKQDIPEAKKTIEKLANLAKKYTGNQEIQGIYLLRIVTLTWKEAVQENNLNYDRLFELAQKSDNDPKMGIVYMGYFDQLFQIKDKGKEKLWKQINYIIYKLNSLLLQNPDNLTAKTTLTFLTQIANAVHPKST